MSSPVRVGTYAPITSKITPVLFLPVGSCKTCTCACLRRRPTPPTKRNTVRNKKAGDARKASEWITEDVTCSWRNSKRARALSDLCWRFHLGLGWTRFGGDRSRIWRKEGKKNYCQMLPIVEEDWRSFFYFVSIGRRRRIYDRRFRFFEEGDGMKNLENGDYLWKNLFYFDWKFNDYDYFAWMKDFLRIRLEIVEREIWKVYWLLFVYQSCIKILSWYLDILNAINITCLLFSI